MTQPLQPKMTPAQFAAAAILAQLSAERTAVARAVLVEGKSWGEAVSPYGWKRQTAATPVRQMEKHWQLYLQACAVAPIPAKSTLR